MDMIRPHGGTLINREVSGAERESLINSARDMERINLNAREVSDLEMIGVGTFSPLIGFMGRADYENVRDHKHLANGLPWTIPITLSVSQADADRYREGKQIALYQEGDHLLGVLTLEEKYTYDKEREAKAVYLTTEAAHPGVAALYAQHEVLLGGPIMLLNHPLNAPFQEYRRTPAQTRAIFAEKKW